VDDTTPAGLPPGALLAADLDLLSEPLRVRATELRRYLNWSRGKDDHAARRHVADQLSLALTAAFAGDQSAAAACITGAETAAGPWRAERAARHAAEQAAQQAAATARRIPRLRRAVAADGDVRPVTDTIAIINGGLTGCVPVAVPDPYLVIATDGSYSGQYYGWAYLGCDGRWGVRAGRGGADPSGGLIAELSAAGMAAGQSRRGVEGVLAVDSRAALGWLARWRARDGTVPVVEGDGALVRRRRGWVSDAAKQVALAPYLDAVHVFGHRGHHLNEAADILAKMARRWRSGEDVTTPEQMTARIGSVCSAFLRSWYAG
jgi:ribonuclease HI